VFRGSADSVEPSYAPAPSRPLPGRERRLTRCAGLIPVASQDLNLHHTRMPQALRASTPTEVLAGLVDRVTFHNSENGFCVLRVKARGQYPAVVIPLSTQHYPMLQRNLVYTGVTRGKRLVVLVGQRKALAIAVKGARTRKRWSKLREWLVAAGRPSMAVSYAPNPAPIGGEPRVDRHLCRW